MKNFNFIIIIKLFILCSCQETNSNQSFKSENYDSLYWNIEQNYEHEIIPFTTTSWSNEITENDQSIFQYEQSLTEIKDLNEIVIILLTKDSLTTSIDTLSISTTFSATFGIAPIFKFENILNSEIPEVLKRNSQVNSSYFIDYKLHQLKTHSKQIIIGITHFDLFPHEDWNFVFGQTNFKNHTAVVSSYRFKNDSVLNEDLLLNTVFHETAHTLNLKHCNTYKCMLNSSANMADLLKRPNFFCLDCTKKLGLFKSIAKTN